MSDFQTALNSFRLRLDRLPEALEAAVNDVVAQVERDILRKFDRQAAPDGTKWRPRKHKYDHPQLNDTGNLRSSLQVTAENSGHNIKVTYGAAYSVFFESLLIPKQGVPKEWRDMFDEAVKKRVEELFR